MQWLGARGVEVADVGYAESDKEFELRIRKIKKRVNKDISSRKWNTLGYAKIPDHVLRGPTDGGTCPTPPTTTSSNDSATSSNNSAASKKGKAVEKPDGGEDSSSYEYETDSDDDANDADDADDGGDGAGGEEDYKAYKVGELVRIDARTTTVEEWEAFEARGIPAVIVGLLDEWEGVVKWTPRRLVRKYGDKMFDVGSHNYCDMTLATFMRYALSNDDDNPLYAFDPYALGSKFPKMLRQFVVPKYFRKDYLKHAGEYDRPLYRWFLLGPKRSGTGIHQDPGFTSAWNALVMGKKRWAFFPPSVSGRDIKPKKGAGDEGIDWWMDVYPRLLPRAEELGMIEHTQVAGETLYVPCKWWHVVLNTEFTISVTQNFASDYNLQKVWGYYKKQRPRFARRWWFKLPEEVRERLGVDDFDVCGVCDGSDSSSDSSSTSGPEA